GFLAIAIGARGERDCEFVSKSERDCSAVLDLREAGSSRGGLSAGAQTTDLQFAAGSGAGFEEHCVGGPERHRSAHDKDRVGDPAVSGRGSDGSAASREKTQAGARFRSEVDRSGATNREAYLH